MANLVYMKTVKPTLPNIDIVAGQVIQAADVNETYYDSENGNRIQFTNVVYLYTEEDRKNYSNPIEEVLYIVSSTAKMYKYKMVAGWVKLTTTSDMYDIIDIVEELVPGTVYRNGQKIAPKTLATVVYTSEGERVEDKLKLISKLGQVTNYYTIPADNMTSFDVPIPFENYFELGNFVEVFLGSVLFDERRYKIENNKLILATTDVQFAKGRDITYRFWFNSSTPPAGVTYSIDGNYIIDRSIPSTKLADTYDGYDLGNNKLIPTMLALTSAYNDLNMKINSVSGNLIAHAISEGSNGKDLVAIIPDWALQNNSTIYLKLHTNLESGATLSVNGGIAIPIYLNYKDPVGSGLVAGDVLSLTYSSMYSKFFINASVAYKLQHYKKMYTAIGGESEIVIDISEFEPLYDELTVHQNSIKLVEDVHFKIVDRKLILIGYNAEKDDLFLFEIDKVSGNGLPIDGNTIMKEIVFTQKVFFKAGVDIVGDLDIKGDINLDGELHFSGGASSGSNFTAEQFVSTATAPKPPMIVASKVMVENFNADMVDGYHAVDLVSPDTTLDFIIDGETDVLDPVLQVTFNSFYGRIDALRNRMVLKDNPDRPTAKKRNIFDSVPESTIDPTDPMFISIVQDTIEDIVYKLDNLRYSMLKTQECEYNILSLNNMTGEEIKAGAHEDPLYLDFFNNIAEMNKSIDNELFDIEAKMLRTVDKDYVDPVTQKELRAAVRELNDLPVLKNYSEVPNIVPVSSSTQDTVTRAKYMMTGGKRIYPITHKNAIVGLPNAELATVYEIEKLQDIIVQLTNRIEALEAISGIGGVTDKAFTYITV